MSNSNQNWGKAPQPKQGGWGKTPPNSEPANAPPQAASVPVTGEAGEVMTVDKARAWQQVIPKLETLQDVKKELAVLYALSKSGCVDVNSTSKMANMLAITARIIETSDIEKRLDALEGK